MILKRIYDPGKLLASVKVVSAGHMQRFSPTFLTEQEKAGVISLNKDKTVLTMNTAPGDPVVSYKLVSGPGYYCCFCEKGLGNSTEAQGHIASFHMGKPSPDSNNPIGYRKDNFYTGIKL